MRSGFLRFTVAWFLFILLLAGCDRSAERKSEAQKVIRVWCHQGQEAENQAMRAIAQAFNTAHQREGWQVEIAFFPDFQYTEKLAIAAAANDMPDAFELDGPLVARFAEAGWLAPLDRWISDEDRADFLPTLLQQGSVQGKLFALGAFESAVVLYYDRELFARAEVTPPAEDQSWTWAEFMEACRSLKNAGVEPLSLHMEDAADEWYTYAFSPVIWSGGGDLISTEGKPRVRHTLASDRNVRSLAAWQQLFSSSYAQTDPIDPNPFGNGKVAMDWSGHWMARTHREIKGAKLGAMPLPRMGEQGVSPCGSWVWSVSAHARNPELAARWLKWVTSTEQGVIPMVRANGAVPARRSAFEAFPEYSEVPYRLFRTQLEQSARPRPRTPVYATLTQRFAAAVRDIARGADVKSRLIQAEDEIQAVIDRRFLSSAEAEARQ